MLISRYIFRQTASALLMILVSLTLIIWLTSLLREIKLLTAQGETFFLFLKITALAVPNLLVTVAPVAFLIAALYTLNRLNGDSELIVLSAAGASVWRIARPYLALGLVVSLLVMAANHFLLPPAARLFTAYVGQIRSDILSQILQPGEFSELDKGVTFHIRDKQDNGTLLGVVIHSDGAAGEDGADKDKDIFTVIAEEGDITSSEGRAVMDLRRGQLLTRQEGKLQSRIVNFDAYTFDLSTYAAKTPYPYVRPRERDTWALLFPDETERYYIEARGKFRTELHERLSTPLYPLTFALIAVLYLGRPRTTRQGRAAQLFAAFLAGAVVRMIGIAGINVLGKHLGAAWIVYGVPLSVMAAALVMLRYNIEPPALSLPALPRFRLGRKVAPGATASP